MSAPTEAEEALTGELAPAPSGWLGTVLLAVSGAALVRGTARLVGRAALAYRKPAVLKLSDRGLELSHRTEMLGRVLRDSETLIPLANLSSVTREVRFGRLGLYSGLLALSLGTYVGVGLLVDGARVPGGSASLIGLGLGAIALGILLDFVLDVLTNAARSTCRVIVTPRIGKAVCIQGLDPSLADRVLARLADAARHSAPRTAEP
jgi:hypothetical protein